MFNIMSPWFEVYMTCNLNSFSRFEQYSFPANFGKSLRNNAQPTILSGSPPWYFLQYHQRYSLKYATHATHNGTPTTLNTLAHHPRHPRWQVTHASTPPTSPTLAQIARHFSNSFQVQYLSNPFTFLDTPKHFREYETWVTSQALDLFLSFYFCLFCVFLRLEIRR